jgi:hypothetical protein
MDTAENVEKIASDTTVSAATIAEFCDEKKNQKAAAMMKVLYFLQPTILLLGHKDCVINNAASSTMMRYLFCD